MEGITIVLVLYKSSLDQSSTFSSLKELGVLSKIKNNDLQLVVYDNSPEIIEPIGLIENIIYKHNPLNPGLATAYNYGLKKAIEKNHEWLMLLDQDSELTKDFVDKMIIRHEKKDNSIVARIPIIHTGTQQISPVSSQTVSPLREKLPNTGIYDSGVMGFNSGALISIEFLEEIGGFNLEFSLDYLDHWLFYKVSSKMKKIEVVDTVIQHNLSILNYNELSLERYQNILDSEVLFYSKYQVKLYKDYHRQLFLRSMKQLLLVKNKKIAKYTLKTLLKTK